MSKKKTIKNTPARTVFVDDNILSNGFSFGSEIYIEYSFNKTTREFSAVVKNRKEDFELTGTMTMTEPAESGTEPTETGTEPTETGTEPTETGTEPTEGGE